MTSTGALTSRHAEMLSILREARERTLHLVEPVSDEDLARQHDALMSPIVWDLAHIAHFEELWLTRNLDGDIRFVEMPGLFNPMEHPRATRGDLDLPSLRQCVDIMASIRTRVVERLGHVDFDRGPELVRDGFVYHLVAQHEYQHNETILQTLQLKAGAPYRPTKRRAVPVPSTPADPSAMVTFAGGEVTIGTDDRRTAYDNERPRHARQMAPFAVDVHPVSNGAYLEFMEAGGYQNPEWWSTEGWVWLQTVNGFEPQGGAGVAAPKYWKHVDGVWVRRSMDRSTPVHPNHPVCHVSYYEAEAYAAFAGKRLPTEFEWEVAATWDPEVGAARRFPWGEEEPSPERANIDQLAFDTAPLGAHPAGVSPLGCHGMIGDVWEWTASDFSGYPGFVAYPYPEYSEIFFGSDYKVLRGGSWATRPGAIRGTFRNWDYPIRRQIFSGFRCVRDV